jgi:hypothetical protein
VTQSPQYADLGACARGHKYDMTSGVTEDENRPCRRRDLVPYVVHFVSTANKSRQMSLKKRVP